MTATQVCRDCGKPFPFDPDADRCHACALDALGGIDALAGIRALLDRLEQDDEEIGDREAVGFTVECTDLENGRRSLIGGVSATRAIADAKRAKLDRDLNSMIDAGDIGWNLEVVRIEPDYDEAVPYRCDHSERTADGRCAHCSRTDDGHEEVAA